MGKIRSEITRIVKMDQALQVWSLLQEFPKMSQAAACAQVGIDPATYHKWIAESGEALEAFRQATLQLKREELAKLIVARGHILDRLIKDALSSYTDPGVRLLIFQFFTQHSEQLLSDVHAKGGNAADFLTGPKLERAESRFSASEADITITIKPHDKAIDITPRDIEEGQE
jgi:hypothetical protein